MSKTKSDIIRESYGKAWDLIKGNTNENGWVTRVVTGHGTTNGMEYEKFGYSVGHLPSNVFVDFTSSMGNYRWRLQSLNGIENNNGWVKIENRLPEAGVWVQVCIEGKYAGDDIYSPVSLKLRESFKARYSHWRVVEKMKDPVY